VGLFFVLGVQCRVGLLQTFKVFHATENSGYTIIVYLSAINLTSFRFILPQRQKVADQQRRIRCRFSRSKQEM
jgi:hypothetical protein